MELYENGHCCRSTTSGAEQGAVIRRTVHGGPFTLRQLLRHQAGLPDYGVLPAYHAAVNRGDAPWSEEIMLERVEAQRLRHKPGSAWSYSNIGYCYVRHLIERSAGEEFGIALQRLVLHPLGLKQVQLARTKYDLNGVEMGEVIAYDPRWVYHGLLVGPLGDATLLLHRLMTENLLRKDLLIAMLDGETLGGPIAGRPWLSPGYGLGVMAGKVNGGLSVAGHTGSGPGSCIAVYRDIRSGTQSCCATFSAGSHVGSIETEAVCLLASVAPNG
ncbi:serine hydrolase domain-containing protein [Noviherbaspirillum sp. L7-7A]|uniref:serine hydrolase domain-containing protein n=1 Tax=Noviherbaspirillum sp. L7-7A TaxID=2850560 RepID=UPI0032C487FD